MLTKNIILIGSEADITRHFLDMTEYTRTVLKDENVLYSEKGVLSQIHKIAYTTSGMGMVFVIIRENDEETEDISLSLKSYYIHIKEI